MQDADLERTSAYVGFLFPCYSTPKLRCATVEGIFRLIQAIPSVKAEPFKAWMAHTAAERLKEEVDPGLAVDRAIRRHQHQTG